MGIFNLFKTVKTKADGKADQAAQTIEDNDPVLFAEQDIKKINEDLTFAQKNVARMKATEMQLKRELKDLEVQKKSLSEKGSQLKQMVESGDTKKKPLLMKAVEKISDIQSEIDPLNVSLKTTQSHLKQHEGNTEKLKKALDAAKRDLRSMKAMEQVTKSTEALSEVNTGNAESALSKFEDRKKKMQMRLDEANATNELQNSVDTLDDDLDAALGNSAHDDILANL